MHSSRVQSLIVLTDPVCIELLFRLEDGPAPVADLACAVRDRLGVDPARVPAYLDGLVGIGFAGVAGGSGVAGGTDEPQFVSLGVEAFRARSADAWRHIHWLHSVGDTVQAHDLELALDAAWDVRSADVVRRRRGALFSRSAAGERHRRRLRQRTLGVAFADDVVCEPHDVVCEPDDVVGEPADSESAADLPVEGRASV